MTYKFSKVLKVSSHYHYENQEVTEIIDMSKMVSVLTE